MSLSIITTMLPNDVVEIAPRGEIDVDTAHEIREAVSAVLTKGRPSRIELNMRLVSFIDSVGISALVSGFQASEVSGCKLAVTQQPVRSPATLGDRASRPVRCPGALFRGRGAGSSRGSLTTRVLPGASRCGRVHSWPPRSSTPGGPCGWAPPSPGATF